LLVVWPGPMGAEINPLHMPGTEPRFFLCPAHSVVTIPMSLPWLTNRMEYKQKNKVFLFITYMFNLMIQNVSRTQAFCSLQIYCVNVLRLKLKTKGSNK
jgi:hypothetical protein